MKRLLRSCVLVPLIAAPLVGCGLIFGGTTQAVQVESTPSGAQIRTQPATRTYTTPASIELKRKNVYTLIATREGYSSAEYELDRNIRGKALAFDIITGLLWIAVDAATGAWYELEPREVSMTLQRMDETVRGPDQIRIDIGVSPDGRTLEVRSSEPGVTTRLVPGHP
ncbi:MAG: hypothetical protein GWM92_04635 [Gemmatimonadetes bacterium]|nr:hypothetical protein [Gemmatimonadota bacterium]NIR77861.1 hypothetical protein [Gemmatimonadota bacterium]NIT86406.1 hypothetical protein [Gemmatimonadota bacterium]NIU30243.1 hypothetical protein [Gemmatimonadota bacterium]NIU35149.1 hypothetical protein [Gemmatimonadota bacterium]